MIVDQEAETAPQLDIISLRLQLAFRAGEPHSWEITPIYSSLTAEQTAEIRAGLADWCQLFFSEIREAARDLARQDYNTAP